MTHSPGSRRAESRSEYGNNTATSAMVSSHSKFSQRKRQSALSNETIDLGSAPASKSNEAPTGNLFEADASIRPSHGRNISPANSLISRRHHTEIGRRDASVSAQSPHAPAVTITNSTVVVNIQNGNQHGTPGNSSLPLAINIAKSTVTVNVLADTPKNGLGQCDGAGWITRGAAESRTQSRKHDAGRNMKSSPSNIQIDGRGTLGNKEWVSKAYGNGNRKEAFPDETQCRHKRKAFSMRDSVNVHQLLQ